MDREHSEIANTSDRRSRMYRIQGIVLRRRNLGEADRILTVFAKEIGKHRIVAKGVRRPGSRMAGHVEPFMVADFMIARTRGLPILSQVEASAVYPRLRSDERAIAVAGMIAERADVMTAEDQAAPQIFALLQNSLELLDNGADPVRVQLIFELVLLRETGFRSGLQSCVECDHPLEAVPNGFDLERGGFVCQQCRPSGGNVRMTSVDVQKVMRMVDRGNIGQVLGVRVRREVFEQAGGLVAEYFEAVTGKDSRASKVIRELRLQYNYQSLSMESEEANGTDR